MLHEDTAEAHTEYTTDSSGLCVFYTDHTLSIGSLMIIRRVEAPPPSPETTPDTVIPLASSPYRCHLLQYLTVLCRILRLRNIRSSPLELSNKQALHKLLSQERKLSSTSGNLHPNSDYSRIFFIKNPSEPHLPRSDWRRYPVHHAAITQVPPRYFSLAAV